MVNTIGTLEHWGILMISLVLYVTTMEMKRVLIHARDLIVEIHGKKEQNL
jgi:hypothetical protein